MQTMSGSDSSDNYDIHSRIKRCLDSIHQSSKASYFANGDVAEADPGLYVEGIGRIGLPVSEQEAKRLILASRPAPFGKGSETHTDTSVRKTREIDADKIRLEHPKWQSTLDLVLQDVRDKLGILGGEGAMKAELYKLLVYEPGAMFKTHTE